MERRCLLELIGVGKDYVTGEVIVRALDDINLEVYEGEVLVILGPSGSGKSTLLHIMGGMDVPTRGIVRLKGDDLASGGEKRLNRYRRQDIGFVFQFYNLLPDLTARENVELAAALVDHALPVRQILREVGLEDRMDHFPAQLSGGEQQRVAIARALVKNPDLILCDEPTGALDHQTGKTVLALLWKINQEKGKTVVIVTHNSAIAAMAHRVIRMKSGRIAGINSNPEPVPPERIDW